MRWRYEWLETLPRTVYAVLVEELLKEQQEREQTR
jgi:hypothetical protein